MNLYQISNVSAKVANNLLQQQDSSLDGVGSLDMALFLAAFSLASCSLLSRLSRLSEEAMVLVVVKRKKLQT